MIDGAQQGEGQGEKDFTTKLPLLGTGLAPLAPHG